MKCILPLLLMISQLVFSQRVSDKNNSDYFIDYNSNQLNLMFNDINIMGSFEIMKGTDYYDYLVVNGNEYHLVMKKFTNTEFYGIDVLKGEFKDVVKGFKKGRKYSSKVEIIYSSLPSTSPKKEFDLITEKEMETMMKEKELSKIVVESGYVGTYKIQILRHDGLDYSKVPTMGKIYITEVGITIETEIPTLTLTRSGYDVNYNSNPSKGEFSCYITKGYGDILSLRLNKENGVGGFTILDGSRTETTTFKIVE